MGWRDHPARLEALAKGERFYCSGVSCKAGHGDQRRVSNGRCPSCQHEEFKQRYKPKSTPAPKPVAVEIARTGSPPGDRLAPPTPNQFPRAALSQYHDSLLGRQNSAHCDTVLRALDGLRPEPTAPTKTNSPTPHKRGGANWETMLTKRTVTPEGRHW